MDSLQCHRRSFHILSGSVLPLPDLAVLSVCKITRAEALPIYFDHAGFSFYFDLAMGFVTDNADSVFRNPGLGQFKHMRKLGLCFEVTNEMELDEVRSVIEFVVTAVNGTERMRMVHLTIYWVSVTKQCTLDAVIGAFSGLSWAGKLKMSYLRIALGRDADLNLSGYHKKVSRAGG